MQKESARGTRLHVTSVGGKRDDHNSIARAKTNNGLQNLSRLAPEALLDLMKPYEGMGIYDKGHENRRMTLEINQRSSSRCHNDHTK